MSKNFWCILTKTRDRTLVVGGLSAVIAVIAGLYYRIGWLTVMMCVLAYVFLYLAIVQFGRPLRNYQRAIVSFEVLLLIAPLYLIIRATIFYLGQFMIIARRLVQRSAERRTLFRVAPDSSG